MALSAVRRALMYVPSSSKRMLEKSRSMTVDTVTYDLEDSVTLDKKAEARHNIVEHLNGPRPPGIREICVRINSVESGLALEDLQEVLKAPNLDAIMLPKCQSASDLHFITDVIQHLLPSRHPTSQSPPTPRSSPPTPSSPASLTSTSSSSSSPSDPPPLKILALIESAQSLINLPSVTHASPYLDGLIFAAEDFAKDLSLTRTPSLTEFLYARSAIATAARAANLSSTIDLVCTSYKGPQGLKTLEEECLGGKALGFNGKQCIHPSQIDVIQRCFAPGEKEVEWAVRVVIGDEKARQLGRGAWTLDGSMIDRPVVGKAEMVVERARACGVDVDAVRERWKGQEPE